MSRGRFLSFSDSIDPPQGSGHLILMSPSLATESPRALTPPLTLLPMIAEIDIDLRHVTNSLCPLWNIVVQGLVAPC